MRFQDAIRSVAVVVVVVVFLALPTPSQSQGSCFPPESFPAGCPSSPPAGSNSSQPDIESIKRATHSRPRFTPLPAGTSIIKYDLIIEGLCEKPGLIKAAAESFVGQRIRWGGYERSVALAAVVTFPRARANETKSVKVPVVVKANFGDPSVQNCEGVVIADVPANEPINLHFEFKSKSAFKFADQSKFIAGVLQIMTGGAGLVSLQGSHVFSPTVGKVVISFIEKNTEPVKQITAGMNAIFESFADETNPDPQQWPIASNAAKIHYKSGNTDIVSIAKRGYISNITINPTGGWLPVPHDFSRAFNKQIADIFTNAQTAVESPWNKNLKAFCEKLRVLAGQATNSDMIATALVIGSHAQSHQFDYEPGKTCSNKLEIATLSKLGYAEPFPGAWAAPVTAQPTSPPRQQQASIFQLWFARLRN